MIPNETLEIKITTDDRDKREYDTTWDFYKFIDRKLLENKNFKFDRYKIETIKLVVEKELSPEESFEELLRPTDPEALVLNDVYGDNIKNFSLHLYQLMECYRFKSSMKRHLIRFIARNLIAEAAQGDYIKNKKEFIKNKVKDIQESLLSEVKFFLENIEI